MCDKDALHRMGVKPSDVAKLVSETFNEMIFTFGDVSALNLWSYTLYCWWDAWRLPVSIQLGCTSVYPQEEKGDGG